MSMIIRELMCQHILYGLTSVQFILTLLTWLSINLFNSLPSFTIAAVVAAFGGGGGIGIAIGLLRNLLPARLYSKRCVNQKIKIWAMH